ncbi:MAG: RNA-binding protein [Rhodospirillaceae bacterium]|nr:RNA-binding protein [Rhodospirillaceae bacterium]
MTMTDAAMVETESDETVARMPARRPQRRCIVSRSTAPKTGLLRCVVGPDGTLVPDASERLPGRGFWVTADRDVIETALKKRNFEKVAGGAVRVPADLADQAAAQVERQCLALLGLARRAGVAVTGHDRVAAMIGKGRAGILLSASDGAADGKRRLEAAAGDVPVVGLFDRDALSAAFGSGNVVHAAIERGNMAARILRETTRLAALRDGRNRR